MGRNTTVLSEKLVVKMIVLLPARSALTVLSEVSNANEVEGSRTASKIPRPLSCGRGQVARPLRVFCNRRDARVRVQRGLASRVSSIFFSEFLTQDTSGALQKRWRDSQSQART